jgi:hypothetical protein
MRLMNEEMKQKLEYAKLLERKIELQEGLPFLHGWKWYPWAREFFESTNRLNFLCAANQISKSSTQIRKCIDWATNQEKWPLLWRHKPNQFWYLYPTGKQCKIEFETKWKQFLPSKDYKTHPMYGWKEEFVNKELFAIHFNSGVHVYFKTYAQDIQSLQTGTCFVRGTPILTPKGEQGIETLKVGDLVLSKDGWRKVVRTTSRVAEVITREFISREKITGTPDHPVWTENRGWVTLGDLRCTDTCIRVTPWLKNTLSSLQERRTFVSRYPKTAGVEPTISPKAGGGKLSTSVFGKSQLEESYRQDMLSTIGMRIQQIIGSKISSSLPALSTREYIGASEKDTFQFVGGVKRSFWRKVLKKLASFAPRTVERQLTQKFWSASGAEFPLLLEKTHLRNIAPTSASTAPNTSEVFDIEVEGGHSFFADGILVHNCDAIFCDEELPVELYDELIFRLSASDGYFHMVFTATLGQEFWRQVIEPSSPEEEKLPEAFKQQVSMYDCLFYEDNSPSHWTHEKIQIVKNRCQTNNEVLKRVYGRFVLVGGRKYESFSMKLHMKPHHPIPKDWHLYAGVDIGSGGPKSHKAAIVFVGVNPNYQEGRVFLGWRGDDVDTTAGDVVEKFIELKGRMKFVMQCYDWASKDFGTIATRRGEPFVSADKGHEKGEQVINTLFKNNMLYIYETPELQKLGAELAGLKRETAKNKAHDDLCDALRYAITRIPWDWSIIGADLPDWAKDEEQAQALTESERNLEERRGRMAKEHEEEWLRIEDELEETNELYGAY